MMLSKYTYKKKNTLLLLLCGFFFIVAYQFGFKRTFILINSVSSLSARYNEAKEAPQKIKALETQLAGIESRIGTTNKASINIQQKILGHVTAYCSANKLTLQQFPKSLLQQEGNILIETNYFIVQGGFVNLLLLVNSIEQKSDVGKIMCTRFQSKKNFINKTQELTATVYIQNLKKNQYENYPL